MMRLLLYPCCRPVHVVFAFVAAAVLRPGSTLEQLWTMLVCCKRTTQLLARFHARPKVNVVSVCDHGDNFCLHSACVALEMVLHLTLPEVPSSGDFRCQNVMVHESRGLGYAIIMIEALRAGLCGRLCSAEGGNSLGSGLHGHGALQLHESSRQGCQSHFVIKACCFSTQQDKTSVATCYGSRIMTATASMIFEI